VSDDELVDDRESNHRRVDLSDFSENNISNRDRDLRENYELINHLFLNFSNV
jgi:hypothetical protein